MVKSDGYLKEAGIESKIADILPKKKKKSVGWRAGRLTKMSNFGKNTQSIMHFANILPLEFFYNLRVLVIRMFLVLIIKNHQNAVL